MKKYLLLLLAVLGLTACSTRLAYNNLDWLVHWYIDDYIDLSKPQKSEFDHHMAMWLTWHRQDELAKYQSHLLELKADIERNNLTTARVEHHFDYGERHWQRLRDQILPELAAMAKGLTDDQVNDMFDSIERDNTNLQEKYAEKTAKDSIDKRKYRIRRNLKQWIGKLNPDQQRIIDEYTTQFVPNYNNWLAHRKQMQNRARTLFASRKNDAEFEAKLIRLMSQPRKDANPVYINNSRANRHTYARLLAALMPTLTSKQKSRLANDIQDYIDDIEELMQD